MTICMSLNDASTKPIQQLAVVVVVVVVLILDMLCWFLCHVRFCQCRYNNFFVLALGMLLHLLLSQLLLVEHVKKFKKICMSVLMA